MSDKPKQKRPYILGSDSKMISMRLPKSTRDQLDSLAKSRGKSKTLVVIEAIDDMAGGDE